MNAIKERPIFFNGEMVRALLNGSKTQTRRIIYPQPPKHEDFPHSIGGLCRSVAPEVKMYCVDDYERLPKHPTDWDLVGSVGEFRDAGYQMRYRCPYGCVGDRMWVRESIKPKPECSAHGDPRGSWATYAADGESVAGNVHCHKSIPSIHMRREWSRITLEITEIATQRLNSISKEDAIAEGVESDVFDQTLGFRNYTAKDNEFGWFVWWGGLEPHIYRDIDVIAQESYRTLWESINGEGSWARNPWVWCVSFRRVE